MGLGVWRGVVGCMHIMLSSLSPWGGDDGATRRVLALTSAVHSVLCQVYGHVWGLNAGLFGLGVCSATTTYLFGVTYTEYIRSQLLGRVQLIVVKSGTSPQQTCSMNNCTVTSQSAVSIHDASYQPLPTKESKHRPQCGWWICRCQIPSRSG